MVPSTIKRSVTLTIFLEEINRNNLGSFIGAFRQALFAAIKEKINRKQQEKPSKSTTKFHVVVLCISHPLNP